jgi:segregation and condensation protein B
MNAHATKSVQPSPESVDPNQASQDQIDPSAILPGIEAMLVSSDRPLKASAIVDALAVHLDRPVAVPIVVEAISLLNGRYDEQKRAFRIEEISGGYRLMTRSKFAPIVAAMHRARATTRLSKPALETLSIIAYRQPITRAELESIRGVACGEVVRTLMDRRLVKITGRAEELGRPMLYGTTRQFLDTFGLASVKDLPKPEDLADQMEQTT